MVDQITTGPSTTAASGSVVNVRGGNSGETVVTDAHGRDYEPTVRQTLFSASTQAAQAITVALATTYTGLCISNPIGNTKNIVLRKVGLALSVAPAGIAPIGIMGNFSITAVTHTAALTPISNMIGSGAAATAKVDNQATIPTPVLIKMLWSGFTAAALPASSPSLIDLDGSIVLIPGAFAAIYALTAVTGLWSLDWEEVSVTV